ncbi:non-homologous end-joining DNA ligase [Limibaculum sp. M0105]|uniref:Non-homologous end-joining DNA ligase n=1 Tax=Thermohalobaculum xanthum TaxID=2753746 RepID=A0A8J7SK12_9RHOB|nr:non-homologous end-joining DNA ligase [Thermohalobaculum xanthum]MBK0401330.1 non-homologous end-joining DNA ligase [Thermohalobaculum xanthum]
MSGRVIEAGGREVEISRPDKVLFPEGGITKGDLADYWARIAGMALPHFRDRPLSMERFPDGIDADGFFQKDTPEHFPDWIERVELEKEGGTVRHVVVSEAATLVFLADQGMITPHLGLSRTDEIRKPDRLVVDLDPSDDDFAKVQRAARRLRGLLDEIGAHPIVQTTGSRGLHVMLALDRSAEFEEVRDFAGKLAARLAERHPDELTVEQRKAKRGDRVFLDILRNAYGQTSVAPYGVRARPGAPVATPLDWDEALSEGLGPRDYTISNIFRRLGQRNDPWTAIDEKADSITALAAALAKRE